MCNEYAIAALAGRNQSISINYDANITTVYTINPMLLSTYNCQSQNIQRPTSNSKKDEE